MRWHLRLGHAGPEPLKYLVNASQRPFDLLHTRAINFPLRRGDTQHKSNFNNYWDDAMTVSTGFGSEFKTIIQGVRYPSNKIIRSHQPLGGQMAEKKKKKKRAFFDMTRRV